MSTQGYSCATHIRWIHEEPERAHRGFPGSLVFADVSGFTNLGERLAKQGRAGSEELTDAINLIFAGMLAAITNTGGELVKFGGDAVLGLFEGPDHESRAARAANAIQGAVAAAGSHTTSVGPIRLSVSVGVASGTVDLFLAGSSPRELIVAGPLASLVIAMESAAEAGQILLSPGTGEALVPECLGAGRAGGMLLVAPPPSDVPVERRPPPPPAWDGRDAIPLHLHDHVPGYGEHRPATVGFIQFKGTDALYERGGGSALAEALDGLVRAAAEAVRARGVTFVSTDVDYNAGKLILAAGAPIASADDSDRMLHAVRDILAADSPLELRAGVNRGPVFSVDVGTDERRVWTVMGDAVNLAARLMAKAAPAQLLASTPTLENARDEYRTTSLEPFHVKGKDTAVEAVVVGEATGTRRVSFPPNGGLVGRGRELGRLREAFAEARSGGRRIVELVGEPGIGKSRLVEAALTEAEGLLPIAIRSGPYGAYSPFLVLREPLRALLGAIAGGGDGGAPDNSETERLLRRAIEQADELDPDWLPLIALPFGLELEETRSTAAISAEDRGARLRGAVGRFLDVIFPAQPMLIVVEDAHWIDEASAALLRYLFGERREAGVAAIVSRRDTGTGLLLDDLDDVERLELEPLGTEAALELIGGRAGEHAIGAAVRDSLVARAGGNPLLLQELAAAARAGGDVDELPDSVEALMAARIDRLPQASRRLVRESSVLGLHLSVELLRDMLELEANEVAAALAGLDEFFVDEGEGRIRFRHDLIRTSAYETLAFRRRRELHRRAGELIEAKSHDPLEQGTELLAIHFRAAGEWPRAWHYARAAGEQAVSRSAPGQAADFYAAALEAGRHVGATDEAIAAVAETLGDVAKLAGRFEEADAAYSRARRLRRGEPHAYAELCLKEGRLREQSRPLPQALAWFTRGLRALEELDGDERTTDLRGRLALAQGAARLRGGRIRNCLPFLERARADAERTGNRSALAHAYYLLDWAHTELGGPESDRYRDLAVPILEEIEDLALLGKALNNAGVNADEEGDWELAIEFYSRALEVNQRQGDVIEAATALSNMAEIRTDQGRLAEAEEMLGEAMASWRAAGYHTGTGLGLSNLGRIATRRGQLREAADLLRRARERLATIGADALVAETGIREAERLLLAGRPENAIAVLDEVRLAIAKLGSAPLLLSAAERLGGYAELQLGERAAARQLFGGSIELASAVAAAYHEALGLEGLAQVEPDPSAAAAARERAGEIYARLGVVEPPAPPLPNAARGPAVTGL